MLGASMAVVGLVPLLPQALRLMKPKRLALTK